MKERALQTKNNLVIDEYAARYIFDYQWPKGTLSFYHLKPLPDYLPKNGDKLKADTWIVSQKRLWVFVPELTSIYPPIFLFGKAFRSLAKRPWEVEFVP